MLFESSSSVVAEQAIGMINSSAPQFSAPGIDAIDGVQIKRIPAGEALGAHDLERWASRRSAGLSKAYTSKDERKKLRRCTKPTTTEQALTLEDAAARGILIEQTSRGWVVSLPDGSNIGPFRKPKDAWSWVDRQPSAQHPKTDKENPCGLSVGASRHHQEGTPGRQAD